jgi:glycosyltransferase involved in cell wall biosynthesis
MRICFYGNLAEALKGKTYGGSELQIALLAKALAKGGHEVVIIDLQATEDFITSDGIKVLMIKERNNGIRFIRFFTHRLPKLYLSLKHQKADIYYCRMRDFTHILAFWAARKAKAKFILAMASDLDALDLRMRIKYYYLPNFGFGGVLWWFFSGILNEIVHPFLLRKSDVVFAQHEKQQQMLLKKQIKSMLFRNLIDLTEIPVLLNPIHKDFIYVGSLDKRKGFAEFFEIIKKAQLYSFKVVGRPRDKTGYKYYEILKSFENVILLGQQNHAETIYHIANSKGLINTSLMEGFPNIFIEAWACGIPVLSLNFDPGGVIKEEGLGDVADGNLDRLLSAMGKIENNGQFEIKTKTYIEQNHALNDNRIREVNSLFEMIAKITAI